MKTMRAVFFLTATVAAAGCSLKEPSIKAEDLASGQGAVIASAGGDQCSSDQEYLAFNLKEKGLRPYLESRGLIAYNPFLKPPYIYGLVLDPGTYILYYSWSGVFRGGKLPLTSGAATVKYEFEVRAGEVTYIGSFTLRCNPLRISVDDQFDQDVDYTVQKSPETDRSKVVKRLARPQE